MAKASASRPARRHNADQVRPRTLAPKRQPKETPKPKPRSGSRAVTRASLRYARLTARDSTTPNRGLQSPFLLTRLVHNHAAVRHILSPPFTARAAPAVI